MRPPSSFSALFAQIFIPIGIFFALLGLIGTLISFPMKNGEPWVFLPIGVFLFLLGFICALDAVWSKSRRTRLLTQGQAVQGTIISVKHHVFVNWNINSFTTIPGKNSPWSLRCWYTWQGRDFTIRSPLLWHCPCKGQSPTIYVNPQRPSQAVVDSDSIRYEIS